MKFAFNINKRHVIVVIALFAIAGFGIAQTANSNPRHDSNEVWVRPITQSGHPTFGAQTLESWLGWLGGKVLDNSQDITDLRTAVTELQQTPSFVMVGQGTKVINRPAIPGTWVDLFSPTDFGLTGWTDTYLVEVSDLSFNSGGAGIYHMSSSFMVNMVFTTNDNGAYPIPSSTSAHAFGGNMMEFRFLAKPGQVPGTIQMRFINNAYLPAQINIPYKILRIDRF